MMQKKVLRIIWIVLLAAIVLLICLFISYCNSPNTSSSSDSVNSEVGEYYSIDDKSETLTINDDMTFSLDIDELSTQGTYSIVTCCWQDYFLILMTDTGKSIVATYSYTKISLTYNGRTIYFYEM